MNDPGAFRPPPRLLLGPGPAAVDPRVLAAMSQPLLGHLDPAFLALMDDVRLRLRRLFGTANTLTLAVPGTGTAGMDAAVGNVVQPDDEVIVCVAGYFGLRMADMVRRAGGRARLVEAEWGRPVEAGEVEKALSEASGPIRAIGLVHAETSTGVLQPLEEIVRLAREHGALVILDAVTSLGGLSLSVDDAGADLCYSGTQKCIGAPPGLAPITVSARGAAWFPRRSAPPASFTLDLLKLEEYWGARRTYHHTAPISTVYALREALRLLEEEGMEARAERHRRVSAQLHRGVEGMGLEFLVEPEHRLPMLTTLRVPQGVDEKEVRGRLLAEHNIEIGGGLGPLAGKVWRVGLMGYSAREENVARLLTALRIILGGKRMSRPARPA